MKKFIPKDFLKEEFKNTCLTDTFEMLRVFLFNSIGDTKYKVEIVKDGYNVTFNEWEVL